MEEFVSYETYDMISHIKDYVLENDYPSIKKLLDAVGIENGTTLYFSDLARTTISEILTYASVQATYDELSEAIAFELVERSAGIIDPFKFMDTMLCYIDYKPDRDVTLPPELLREFKLVEPSANFYSMVCSLSEEEFLMLIYLILKEKLSEKLGNTATAISRSTLPALLSYAYCNHVLPGDIFFAYLASNLTGVDDGFFETQRAIGNEDDIFGEDDEDYDD